MYKLSIKVQKLLKSNADLRRKVALQMGLGENAVTMDLRRSGGQNVAKNYDAINRIIDETGLTVADIRIGLQTKKITA